MRELTSHHCGPGSSPEPDITCGLSLLFVLVLASRVFSSGSPVFLPPQKTNMLNCNSALLHVSLQNELLISLALHG